MLLSLHPNIIVDVENVVSLFSSPSTSSQKVRKCGCHKFLSQAIWLELEQSRFDHYTHPCVPTVYACEFCCLHLVLVQKVRKLQKIENTQVLLLCMVYVGINILEKVEVVLSRFEWKSRDSPTETRLTDRY